MHSATCEPASDQHPARRQPTHAYSVALLAERWGTSDQFVYDQIKAGRLAAFKLGNKLIRIRPEAVDEYEAAAAVQPEPVPIPVPVPRGDAAADAARIARLIRRQHSPT